MKRPLLIIIFTCACWLLQAQVNIITTIAGNGTPPLLGDGGPAVEATLNGPSGICLDRFKHLYVADAYNNRVRKIDLSTGIITTIAGIDSAGYSGDTGPATKAKLNKPNDVFTDSTGNVYIADGLNNRIRKVAIATGTITTIAGNGIAGGSGDGGSATNAELHKPSGLYIDKDNNIFFCDEGNYKVRKIDGVSHVITTIAGNGTMGNSGDNGPAINAQIAAPGQLFGDENGNIIFSDFQSSVVRRIDAATGIITTIAGNGGGGPNGDGGPAIDARLYLPFGIFIDKQNNIFIADDDNGAIRRVDGLTGIITTVAGNGVSGFSGDHGSATNAQLEPDDMVVDVDGTMYIADYVNNRIRRVMSNVGVAFVSNQNNINVFPNPAQNELHIEGAENCEVKVFNLLGLESMDRFKLTSDNAQINIQQLTPGIYTIQIIQNNGMAKNTSIIKE